MIAQDVRIDSLSSTPGNVQYNATLTNIKKADIDVEAFKQEVYQEILSDIQNKPEFEAFKKSNITLFFSYNDKEKQNICNLKFTANQYK